MKRREIIISIAVLCCLFVAPTLLSAASRGKGGTQWVWRENVNRHGLYAEKRQNVGDLFSFQVDGVYYYGDVENQGFFLASPEWRNLGFQVGLNYSQSLIERLNLRYTIAGGYLSGNKSHIPQEVSTSQRQFDSYNGKFAVGVEWYPLQGKGNGFYVYAGLALQYSYLQYKIGDEEGVDHAVLPMIPVELGYTWRFGEQKNWMVGLHVGLSQGLCDEQHANLDAWPTGPYGNSKYNRWADGYVSAGITISYTWQSCKRCQLVEE